MSVVAIVLIALGALVLLLLVGGLIGASRRNRAGADQLQRNLAEADHALEEARAADRGWDRAVLEETARRALEESRPGWRPERLDLILVDDRPGVNEDRAVLEASGEGETVQLVLTRDEGGHWAAQAAG
jgi:hypothetical protein